MFRASAEPEAALKRKQNIVNMLESRPFEPRGRLPASPDPGGPGCQHGGGTSTCDQHQDHTRRSDLGVHHDLDEMQDAATAAETPQVGVQVRCESSGNVPWLGAWGLCGRAGTLLSCNGG